MIDEGKSDKKMEREREREKIYAKAKESGALTEKAETTFKSNPLTLGIYQLRITCKHSKVNN